MRRITLQSERYSPVQMEEILIKAVNSLKEYRENRAVEDKFVKNLVETSDKVFAQVINHMVKELEVIVK